MAAQMTKPMAKLPLALACIAAVVAACGGDGAQTTYRVLEDGVGPLRAAFNADSGKVRAIFLAAPT